MGEQLLSIATALLWFKFEETRIKFLLDCMEKWKIPKRFTDELSNILLNWKKPFKDFFRYQIWKYVFAHLWSLIRSLIYVSEVQEVIKLKDLGPPRSFQSIIIVTKKINRRYKLLFRKLVDPYCLYFITHVLCRVCGLFDLTI